MVNDPPANTKDAGNVGLIPGRGRCPGGGNGNPLQYSRLENPMDSGVWRATVRIVAESDMADRTHYPSRLTQSLVSSSKHPAFPRFSDWDFLFSEEL